MKLKYVAILTLGVLPFGATAQPAKTATPPAGFPLSTSTTPAVMPEKGKLSYAIGMYFGRNIEGGIKQGHLDLNTADVMAAIGDIVSNKTTRLTETEMMATLKQFKEVRSAQAEGEAVEAKAKGEAFLAQFAKSAGTKTLPDGIEYKVIKDGTGPMPTENDKVIVKYRGTFIDGTEFDHGDDFNCSLRGGVITGWLKVLPLMKVGSEWEIAIPSSLAYGQRGSPPRIPPNSTLIFQIELKKIVPGEPAPAPALKPSAAASTAPVVSGEIIKVPSADELKKGAKIEVIKSGQTNTASAQ